MKRAAIIGAICTVLALLFLAPHAAAQGCAMCYQNAAASGAKGQAALRHGIMILLIPALGLFGGIFATIYRRNDPSSQE
ncbi:MAG TPA: hypothetical protein VMB47_07130 [Candidatus Aquilonibacter sp.]|nr:hypothetical protein [Candidatus Aquilonibacter sp.]